MASEETDIIDALEVSDKKVSNLTLNGNYSDALVVLSNLHPKVERFFEKIQINSDNSLLRRNRLCILGLIRSMLSRLADFSILEWVAHYSDCTITPIKLRNLVDTWNDS